MATSCSGASRGKFACSVLAPLLVALSALVVVPSLQAEPTAPLFVVEQQRSALVTRLAKQWSDAFAVLPSDRRLTHKQLSSVLWALRADRLFALTRRIWRRSSTNCWRSVVVSPALPDYRLPVVDSGVGDGVSLALGADGLPVVAYHDMTNGDLKVAKCSSAT